MIYWNIIIYIKTFNYNFNYIKKLIKVCIYYNIRYKVKLYMMNLKSLHYIVKNWNIKILFNYKSTIKYLKMEKYWQ